MKKCLPIIIIIFMFIFISPVDAASFQMMASTNSVSPNQTFTLQVGGDCIGRVDLTVYNGTLSTNSIWVEQGYTNVEVTAGSSGTVSITATPAIGFSDSDANLYQPGSRTVTISILSPSVLSSPQKPSVNNPTIIEPTTPLSGDNTLSSLTVSDGTLEPNFDSSNTEYSLNLGPDITTIQIDATPSEENATIEGLGEIKLNPGNNIIELLVTALNGEQKIYKINVYVDDSPQIYLDYQKQKIGIIRNLEGVIIPEDFEREEYSIDGKTISIFKKGKITLIYGINQKEEKQFYLYDKEKNKIINTLIPIKINEQNIYIVDKKSIKGMKPISIIINEKEITCYQFEKNSNYCLLDAINNDGKVVQYLYEKTEGTIQLYPKFLAECNVQYNYIPIYILGGLLVFTVGILVFIIVRQKKGKKHEKTK